MLTIYDVPQRRDGSLALALCLSSACGPSFQTVYEGDVRFEHCYALDETSTPADSKKECWRLWLRSYTNGQSMDRVQYAATRFSQLSLGPTLPSEEPQEARPRRRGPNVAAPVPTSAFAPPPNLAASAPAAAAAPPSDVVHERDPRTPRAECCEECAERWSSCHGSCQGTTCDACDATYRACMPACFREDAGAPAHSVPASASTPTSRVSK